MSLDKGYQMGLIGSLSHGYPLVDPHVAGRLVHYHIFSQILLAVPVRLFGLTPYSLGYELRQVSRSVTLSGWTDAPGYPTLVSPGIGTSKLPIRVNCEPTIHLITVG